MRRLSEQLLEDMDLRWQMDQLSDNLRQAFPDAGWGAQYSFDGADPLDWSMASSIMGELGDLDQIERMIQSAAEPGALAEIDFDRVRELIGEQEAESLERISRLASELQDAGLVEHREGKLELTPRGMRRLGQDALSQLFRKLDKDLLGRHEVDSRGFGHERSFQTRPYQWGDSFDLNLERTIRNAILRGERSPVRLSPDDFEIEETESVARTSTVLMLDLSLSMPMRDNYLPAKKVTMALHSLISMQYPSDYLGMVVFSESARVITAEELPEVTWDYVYGTNMAHGFQLARDLLRKQSGTKQIIMITDGEPTAHINRFGVPEFHYPPVQETVDATMLEVARCTRERIRINTFMLEPDPALQHFVQVMAKVNGGRTFFTTPETLGKYVLVDFIENRRKVIGRG
ncbi:MAG: VWA domain-containing protein [Microthrixaceae bacterium]